MLDETVREWQEARKAFLSLETNDVRYSAEAKAALERLSTAENNLALAALPSGAEPVAWRPITDMTPPDDAYWQMAVKEIDGAATGFRHAMLTNHHAATLLAWANLARDAVLTSPHSSSQVTEERFPVTLGKVHQAIDGYVQALVERKHGGVALDHAFGAICDALGRSTTAELDARRAALYPVKGDGK